MISYAVCDDPYHVFWSIAVMISLFLHVLNLRRYYNWFRRIIGHKNIFPSFVDFDFDHIGESCPFINVTFYCEFPKSIWCFCLHALKSHWISTKVLPIFGTIVACSFSVPNSPITLISSNMVRLLILERLNCFKFLVL